jgi:UDP-N-acetylmuramate dehydrogenase
MGIEERFQTGRFLNELSTFGIGGPIRLYFKAIQIQDAEQAIQWSQLQNVPYLILGKGSNCLFDDRGFSGLVIHNQIDFCSIDACKVFVGAGHSFSRLGIQTARQDLSGLEFAAGIPGSVGGAIYMNAGANGQEICQTLEEVIYFDPARGQKSFFPNQLSFGHRQSIFQSLPGVILAARFALEKNPFARKNQLAYINYRMATQPLKEKSAGCAFRNPAKDQSAGALIDRCGLKGFAIGGAKVSEMHANFIVNAASATQADVLALMQRVRQKVYEKTGIWLEPEIKVVSFDGDRVSS